MPIRAKKDIICYKMLTIDWTNEHRYGIDIFTPYLYHHAYINMPNIATPYEWKFNPFIMSISTGTVTTGMVHAFTKINYAAKAYNIRGNNFVVEAIIPKGTLYFISFDRLTICAKEMIYTDKIIKYPTDPQWQENLILII